VIARSISMSASEALMTGEAERKLPGMGSLSAT
jgi:hypothetical protein